MFRSGPLLKLLGLSILSIVAVNGTPLFIHRFGAKWFYMERAVPSMAVVAMVTAFLLPALCLAIRDVRVSERHPVIRFTRKAAAATFPLYLIHFPLFVLLAVAIPYRHESLIAKLGILSGAFALSLLLAGPCDQLKDYLRHKLVPKKIV